MQPTGEMYTVYLSDDGEQYNTAREAEARDTEMARRSTSTRWARYDWGEHGWFVVRDQGELITLSSVMKQAGPAVLTSYPALVRWEYNDHSRWDDFYFITHEEAGNLITQLLHHRRM